jgi:Fe2+ transport system protein B
LQRTDKENMNTLITIGLYTIGLSIGLPIFILLMFLVFTGGFVIFSATVFSLNKLFKTSEDFVKENKKIITVISLISWLVFVAVITYNLYQ